MEKTVKISEARRTLFDLVDEVTQESDTVIWIEHRDRAEQVALVNARYLHSLRTRIEELRRQTKPFQLAGSMTVRGGVEEAEAALERLRGEEAGATVARFRDL